MPPLPDAPVPLRTVGRVGRRVLSRLEEVVQDRRRRQRVPPLLLLLVRQARSAPCPSRPGPMSAARPARARAGPAAAAASPRTPARSAPAARPSRPYSAAHRSLPRPAAAAGCPPADPPRPGHRLKQRRAPAVLPIHLDYRQRRHHTRRGIARSETGPLIPKIDRDVPDGGSIADPGDSCEQNGRFWVWFGGDLQRWGLRSTGFASLIRCIDPWADAPDEGAARIQLIETPADHAPGAHTQAPSLSCLRMYARAASTCAASLQRFIAHPRAQIVPGSRSRTA
jgi:hypothetical protein